MELHEGNYIKITKLDKRFNGHRFFLYGLSIETTKPFYNSSFKKKLDATLLRDWCTAQYGTSTELDTYHLRVEAKSHNPNWAWEYNDNLLRIYVNDEALVHICLTFNAHK